MIRTVLATCSLALLLLARSADAGLETWTGSGPEGGGIRALLVDPAAETTIYAGTVGSGVFKSADSGGTWAQTDPTGPLAGHTVRALVFGAAGTLYAGADDPVDATTGGVFQSVDGGGTWTVIGTTASGLANKKVMALAFANGILYAGTREEAVGGTTYTGGVYAWDGAAWTNINNGGLPSQSARRVQALALDTRQNPATIYAGTQGAGVYKSIDGGATWNQLSNQGFRSDCLGTFVNGVVGGIEILSLAVDTTIQAETLYAGATGEVGNTGCHPTPSEGGHQGQGAGFFRFTSSSGDWDRRMAGDFELLLPTTVSTNVWSIAMNGSTIFVGSDIGVFRSTTGSGSWDAVPRLPTVSTLQSLPARAVATGTGANARVYAGSSGRGVFVRLPPNTAASTGTQNWTASSSGLTALRAQSIALGSRDGFKTLIGGLSSGGVVTSIDGGATWQGSSDTARSVLAISTDPTAPNVAYAATGAGLFKSTDTGQTWSPSGSGLPTKTTQNPNTPTVPRTVKSVVVDVADPQTVYAAVGGLYRSVDGGATWTAINGNLPAGVTDGDGTVTAIAIDYVSAGVNPTWGNLYIATDGLGVLRSTNGGTTWAAVNGILATDLSIQSLGFDPLPPATLYAGTGTGKIYRVLVGGGNFSAFGTGLPAGLPISGLAVKLGAPSTVFATSNGGGAFRIASNGASWTAINSGLPSLSVAALAFDPDQPGTLYAATLGRGFVDYVLDAGFPLPFVSIDSPAPPTFSTSATSVTVSGSVGAIGGTFKVFWSTNRGHAGVATGTSAWSASVPLEVGSNIVTVTAVDNSFRQGSASLTVDSNPPAAHLTAVPPSVNFGSVNVGVASGAQTVTITNDGNTGTVLGTVSLGGANPEQYKLVAAQDLCSGRTLGTTQSCTVQIKFKPTAGGSWSAALLVPSGAPDTPLSVALSGTGVGGGPALVVTPSPFAFPNTAVGAVSAGAPFTVKNNTAGSIVLGTVGVAGANADQFKLVVAQDGCSGQTLASQQTCSLQVKFKPTNGGPQSATLSIPSNAPPSPTTVALTGTGTGPEITVTPASIPFGSVAVGSVTSPQVVTVKNDGTAALVLGAVSLGGSNPSQFKLVVAQDTCSGASLGAGQTCSVQVRFKPTVAGPANATLSIPSNDASEPTSAVALSGTGT